MKEKLVDFIKSKKELIVFTSIIIAIFSAVIAISNIALKEESSIQTITPQEPTIEEPIIESPVVYYMSSPVSGDYQIVRNFYDMTYDTEVLKDAFIKTNTTLYESKGVSYSGINNESLDVYTILPGKVINIEETELYGIVVTILHDDGIISRYKSLSSVTVNVNDKLTEKAKIGLTGESLYDKEANNHVHVEVIVNGNYLDLTKLEGIKSSEVSSMK